MKVRITEISCQITVNLGNFENMRLGAVAEPPQDGSITPEEGMMELVDWLHDQIEGTAEALGKVPKARIEPKNKRPLRG